MFISNAFAQTAAGAAPENSLLTLWPIILMFVVMYFLMIRPQMKRQKEQKAMMDALGKGDEVIAAGGVLGKITKVSDVYVTLEVADATEIVVQKSAINTLLPKGTIKSL
ncbi:MAG: preprotein translocase subunit YajC [Burkholderiales bacterium]|nr:preprotein translocase subunit YajC [Burkholderiales bacterium]